MKSKKLAKPIKSVVLGDCGFRIEEEDDGLVIHVFPIHEDDEGNVRARKIKGSCRSVIDFLGNLVGCEDVGACNKDCLICTIYDSDGNELGESCGCRDKCPDEDDD